MTSHLYNDEEMEAPFEAGAEPSPSCNPLGGATVDNETGDGEIVPPLMHHSHNNRPSAVGHESAEKRCHLQMQQSGYGSGT